MDEMSGQGHVPVPPSHSRMPNDEHSFGDDPNAKRDVQGPWYTRVEYLGLILAAATALGVTQQMQGLLSERRTSWLIIGALFGIAWWRSLVKWRRILKEMLPSRADPEVRGRIRWDAVRLLILTLGAAIVFIASSPSFRHADVVIARFGRDDGSLKLGPDRYSIAPSLYSQFQDSLRGSLGDCPVPTVALLDESLPIQCDEDVFSDIGSRYGAKLVIWGWYSEPGTLVRLTTSGRLLCGVRLSIRMPGNTGFFPIEEFKSFKIQTRLGGHFLGVIYFIRALEAYSIRRFDCGLADLQKIEEQGLLDQFEDKSQYYRLRGDCRLLSGEAALAMRDYDLVSPGSEQYYGAKRNRFVASISLTSVASTSEVTASDGDRSMLMRMCARQALAAARRAAVSSMSADSARVSSLRDGPDEGASEILYPIEFSGIIAPQNTSSDSTGKNVSAFRSDRTSNGGVKYDDSLQSWKPARKPDDQPPFVRNLIVVPLDSGKWIEFRFCRAQDDLKGSSVVGQKILYTNVYTLQNLDRFVYKLADSTRIEYRVYDLKSKKTYVTTESAYLQQRSLKLKLQNEDPSVLMK